MKNTQVTNAAGIIANLTGLLSAFEASVYTAEQAEAAKHPMMEKSGFILANGTSNSAEFNEQIRLIGRLDEAREKSRADLHAALESSAPFVRDLFQTVMDENLRLATAAAVPYCIGKENLAGLHASQAFEVWTVRDLVEATHNQMVGSACGRAKLFMLHLNLWLKDQANSGDSQTN